MRRTCARIFVLRDFSGLVASRTLPFTLGIPLAYLCVCVCVCDFFPRTVRAAATCLPGCVALITITISSLLIPSWYSRRLIDSINFQVRGPHSASSSTALRQRERKRRRALTRNVYVVMANVHTPRRRRDAFVHFPCFFHLEKNNVSDFIG